MHTPDCLCTHLAVYAHTSRLCTHFSSINLHTSLSVTALISILTISVSMHSPWRGVDVRNTQRAGGILADRSGFQ